MALDTDILKQAMFSTKLSRLLAQENIAVEFSEHAETASFAPRERILNFPYSTTFMESDVHELFMMHEISHALHLPRDIFERLKSSGINPDLFNIIIDIRDERLIKQKYPGSIKAFNSGYEKLLEQGFFGKKEEINFKRFGDRLNVYAKVGVSTGSFIKMTPAEHSFYDRCMEIETIEEAIAMTRELAKIDGSRYLSDIDLLSYIKENMSEEDFVDSEGKEKTQEEIDQLIDDMYQKIKEDRVQEAFNENFKSSLMKNVAIYNYFSVQKKDLAVAEAKKYFEHVKGRLSNKYELLEVTAPVRDMRASIKQSVDSMVRVFESRKAAARYKNARVSDTGSVDINKVYRYQFDEKIFRRSVKLNNSKNHGYVILLDLSGSMSRVIHDVIEQVIVIAEFFRRIQVPYKVIGFGASVTPDLCSYSNYYDKPLDRSTVPSMIFGGHPEPLIEFLNSSQTTFEHNVAIYGMLHRYGFSLGGTPTGRAVLDSELIATEFFDKLGVDQRHLIVMTDGEPTDLSLNGWGSKGKTLFFADAKTKKNVIVRGNASYAGINAMGKILEYRHGIKMTTVCITRSYNDYNISSFITAGASDADKSHWRTKGYVKMVDPYTHNPVYFAKPFNVDTDIENFDISKAATTSQIARAITKNMKSVKKSRTFLNALAESLS